MISTSPAEKIDQLITVFSQRLQPPTLQRLSVAEILQDAAALAMMKEEMPAVDSFRLEKQQQSCFGRLLKFLQMHEPTGYERDEEHKRMAVRYLALRTMIQQCKDIKIQSIQEVCLSKVLRWFEETESSAFMSIIASTPILPPRMSPKKQRTALSPALDKCSSETSFFPNSSVSNATKLEKYKMPDLRASHIRRIAELRSRGADISDEVPFGVLNNNLSDHTRDEGLSLDQKEDERRMIEATFKIYRPETDAERELNLLWIQRRNEEKLTRQKDLEVQQQVQKWAMNRSRNESEYLRKHESAKLVAGLEQTSQEGVDQDRPFAWRSTRSIHPDLAKMAAESNQAVPSVPTRKSSVKEVKEVVQPVDTTTYKQREQKQPAQIVIKSKKSPATGGGMHFRNQLPPNYKPPGLLAAASLPRDKRDISLLTTKATAEDKTSPNSANNLNRTGSEGTDDGSSASENEQEGSEAEGAKRKKKKEVHVAHPEMTLQSYHMPNYYSNHSSTQGRHGTQKNHPRGTLPVEPLPADPEIRCLQQARAMRRVFALPHEKKPIGVLSTSALSSIPASHASQSSRRSDRPGADRPLRGAQSAGGARARMGGFTLSKTAAPEIGGATSTSDLRQSQLEEVDKIRRLFELNNLSFSADVLERGLLVPEDRPLLESIYNLPFAGSRLLGNPLTRRSKANKAKKKSVTKKKAKKGKKGSKGSKTPKGARRKSTLK